jgi:N-acetyl-anhydromuramyl-L-alanine amidase AmpD
MTHATIGQEVVRVSGDFYIGRTGTVIALDTDKKRAQVDWTRGSTTWVSLKVIEPTSIPYEIVTLKKYGFPKYRRTA